MSELQAVLPFVVICIPVMGVVVCALAHIDVPQAGHWTIALMVWLASVKPLATIAVVPRYRAYVLAKLLPIRVQPKAAHRSATSNTDAAS